jgi:hypothetical protein
MLLGSLLNVSFLSSHLELKGKPGSKAEAKEELNQIWGPKGQFTHLRVLNRLDLMRSEAALVVVQRRAPGPKLLFITRRDDRKQLAYLGNAFSMAYLSRILIAWDFHRAFARSSCRANTSLGVRRVFFMSLGMGYGASFAHISDIAPLCDRILSSCIVSAAACPCY